MGDTAAVDKVGGEGIAVQLGVIFAVAGLGNAYVEQYNIARKLTAGDVKLTRFTAPSAKVISARNEYSSAFPSVALQPEAMSAQKRRAALPLQ